MLVNARRVMGLPGCLEKAFDAVGIFDQRLRIFNLKHASDRRDLAGCQTVIRKAGGGEDFCFGGIPGADVNDVTEFFSADGSKAATIP